MNQNRRFMPLLLHVLLLVAIVLPVGAQTPEAAPDDSTATQAGSATGLSGLVDQAETLQGFAEPAKPWLLSWTRDPGAKVRAGIRSSSYMANFDNTLLFGDQSRLSQTLLYSYEDYRTQEKIVQRRDGNINYNTSSTRSLQGNLTLGQNWSEDEITNSTGQTTLNKRDFRSARASLKRNSLEVAGTSHDVSLDGSVSDQQGEQQGQRNDFSEARLQGAVRSSWQPKEWMTLSTGAFAMTESGERTLGRETTPSTASGDSMRAGLGYQRGRWHGFVGVRSSNFDKEYLDYRRNSSGVVDTIGVADKTVDELESDDAVTIEWNNRIAYGPASLVVKLAQDASEKRYKYSGVGTKEKRNDTVDVTLGLRVARADSVQFVYRYQWRWDNQTYQGATEARGRQIYYNRNVQFTWLHDLFEYTDLRVNMTSGLTQDIAEGRFNENDRDRLDSAANIKVGTQWPSGFDVGLVFDARRSEDVAIRSSRSANNSIKETYEINPSYGWNIARWINLDQSFRVWIQYTDYVYSDLEEVNKEDDFNKRGNLETKLTLTPNRRLRVVLSHNYNIKLNGKKTNTDAAGYSSYFRESDQRINKLNVAINYKVYDWFTLDGTTFKGRDYKESFGTTTRETERFSGELGIGGTVDKKFGDGKSLKAGLRRIYAHGPNVQETGKEYWDADIQLGWRF